MQALSGMVVYFIVMNDYGFKPSTLLFLNLAPGFVPKPTDLYDPNDSPSYGNNNFNFEDSNPKTMYNTVNGLPSGISWGSNEGSSMDLRLFYTQLTPDAWAPCQYMPGETSVPQFYTISTVTKRQICYTSEALFYAQT